MKILIVGGGIAGPALVSQLKKHTVDCEVTLIEQAPAFKDIGFGIVLWGNGRKVLKEVGLDDGLIQKEGYELPWDTYESTERRLMKSVSFGQFKSFGSTLLIPRALLHKTLISAVNPSIVQLNTKLVSIIKNDSSGVDVELTDGSKNHYDLLVAADGVHSWVREQVFGPGSLKPYGWSVWTCWVPKTFSLSKGLVSIAGNGKLVSLFPMLDQSMVHFAAIREPGLPDDPEQRRENLIKLFSEFGDDIQHIIQAVPHGKDILFSDIAHIDMHTWYKNRVVLIGDAQHALSPITGMGASLALEDACVLAHELSKNKDIDVALESFQNRRNPRLEKFKFQARFLESWIMSRGLKAKIRNTFASILPEFIFLGFIKGLLKEEM